MAKFHQFCANLPSCKYIFKSGKVANFVGGKYVTTIDSEIAELEEEIKFGHPHIFVDANERTVESEKADPLAAIKKKAIEEYLAAQAKAVDPNNDMGNTVGGNSAVAGIQTSQTVSGISRGSVTVGKK